MSEAAVAHVPVTGYARRDVRGASASSEGCGRPAARAHLAAVGGHGRVRLTKVYQHEEERIGQQRGARRGVSLRPRAAPPTAAGGGGRAAATGTGASGGCGGGGTRRRRSGARRGAGRTVTAAAAAAATGCGRVAVAVAVAVVAVAVRVGDLRLHRGLVIFIRLVIFIQPPPVLCARGRLRVVGVLIHVLCAAPRAVTAALLTAKVAIWAITAAVALTPFILAFAAAAAAAVAIDTAPAAAAPTCHRRRGT